MAVHHIDGRGLTCPEGRLRDCLRDYSDAVKARHAWHLPLGWLISLVTTLVVTDFEPRFGVSAALWQSAFICAALVCCVWSLIAVVNLACRWKRGGVDHFIRRLKSPPE